MKTIHIKRNAIISLLVVLVVATILGIFSLPKAYGSTSFNGTPNLFFSVGTSTAETVGTSNTQILATSTGRTWARIANTGGNAITCIYKNGAAATVTNGFIIAASSTFEMNQLAEPVYTGGVSCISDTGSAASIYVEANQ